MLELKNLCVNYGGIQALKDVSLTVKTGEVVCLIGANGAGKSTTLRAISRIIRPKSGSIIFNNTDVSRFEAAHVVRLGIAQSPEGRQVLSRQSVRDNLEMGAYVRNDNEINADIDLQFQRFPRLLERQNQLAGTLSGGEQQMLAIARALMSRPKLLLLDEPSLGLAPIIVKEIMGIIDTLRESGMTILLVEQNARLALQHADRGYVLEAGNLIFDGNAKDLLDDPRIKKAYLG